MKTAKDREKTDTSFKGSDDRIYKGKGAKARRALEKSQRHWDNVFRPAQSTRGCPCQRPGSMKCS